MFPSQFIESNSEELIVALDGVPETSIRYNPLKSKPQPNAELVPWCEDAVYLSERPLFTVDPLFHGGSYYVQEASSMFIGWMAERLGINKGSRVLDLCAAPGGKTTHLSQYAGIVVANEVIRSRAKVLSENVQRWGSGNIVVTSNDAKDFGERVVSFFDMMLIDTPCSGEGMFRKDRKARDEWSVEAVELCAARSRRIVSDAWAALKDGGILIYSTCTFNRLENEDNAEWICKELGGEIIEFADIPQVGIVATEAGCRFFPHLVRGEGFYAVAIRKSGNEYRAEYSQRKSNKSLTLLTKDEQTQVSKWIVNELYLAVGGGSVYGFTSDMWQIIEYMRANLNLIYSGVLMGELIRCELKPSHSLAMYYDVCFDNRVDLPLDAALEYLRRGAPTLSHFPKEGLALVTYEKLPIGWLKRISNRANNLYPQNLRIVHY